MRLWVHAYRTSEIEKKPVKGGSGSETWGKLRKKRCRCLPGHETKHFQLQGKSESKVFTKEALLLVVQVWSWGVPSAVFCWGQSKVFTKEALVVQVQSWWAPSALFCWGQTLCHQGNLVADLCANGEGFPWWTFFRSVSWGWDLWWISCHADLYFCFVFRVQDKIYCTLCG